MTDQFLSEIRIVPFNFAPQGWAMCQGQTLPIGQNAALFTLLGTYYGGNGTSNFQLPNFQGNVPLGQGSGTGLTQRSVGETGGEASVTLQQTEMAAHTHAQNGDFTLASAKSPVNALPAAFPGSRGHSEPGYITGTTPTVSMAPGNLFTAGGGQPHNNFMPSLVLNFVIALVGIYPQRS